MRHLPTLLIGITLFVVFGCATHKNAVNKNREQYVIAIFMPANVVKNHEDDPSVYDGVEFPLFCGFAMVYPEENKFVFIPKTNLPIDWVKWHMGGIERRGYVFSYYNHVSQEVYIKDKGFYEAFRNFTETISLWPWIVYDDLDSPEALPPFERLCPYDSKKDPPVECGLTRGDIPRLYLAAP